MKTRFAMIFVLALLTPFAVAAQQAAQDGDLVVTDAWTRATPEGGQEASVFFTLRSTGQKTVRLIGVRSDRASIETLHKTEINTLGVARMSAKPELRLEPGDTLVLAPGGLHVMLLDLETPLIEGERCLFA
jgi:periplasmic copper chaperone A